MSNSFRSLGRKIRPYFLGTLAAATVLSPTVAQAHNGSVHQSMVEISYDVMAAAAFQSSSPEAGLCMAGYSGQDFIDAPPANDPATVAAWKEFLGELSTAMCDIRAMKSDLPALMPGEGTRCASAYPDMDPLPGNWNGPTLQGVERAVTTGYAYNHDACNLNPYHEESKGFFNSSSGGLVDSLQGREKTGNILGYWAAAIDNQDGDLSTELAIKNEAVINVVNKLVAGTTTAVWHAIEGIWVAIECAWDWLFGDSDDCIHHVHGWWDTFTTDEQKIEDVIRSAESLITIPQGPSHAYVGVWHHIVMAPRDMSAYDPDGVLTDQVRYGAYDDRRGFRMENSGPFGYPDAFEIVAMAGADIIGLSVDSKHSDGISRYQIVAGGDGHPDTSLRPSADFETETIPHIEFEPVDNLAKWGWEQFKAQGGNHAANLGWTLHALGDATVPHHVVGSVGWGHRPFEDAMENLWPVLTYQQYQNPASGEKAEQVKQARRVLVSAFHWSQWIKQTQVARGSSDVPVRDLVTELAQQTYDTSMEISQASGNEWPYNDLASLAYQGGDLVDTIAGSSTFHSKEGAIAHYTSYTSPTGQTAAELYRPMAENGMGAMLAFLSATAKAHPNPDAVCTKPSASSINVVDGCVEIQ